MNTSDHKQRVIAPIAVAIMLSLTAAVHATAATIISETFSGSGATNLVGTTTPDGNNWIGSSNTSYKQNGSISGSVSRTAYLPFTLTQGLTYTLQVDLDPSDTGDDWLGAGFSVNSNNGDRQANQDGGSAYAWMLLRGNNNAQTFTGSNTGGGASHSSLTGDTMKIVLDTTNASNYTAQFFDEAGLLRSVGIGNPNLGHVFISSYNTAGSFDNFSLSDNTISGYVGDVQPGGPGAIGDEVIVGSLQNVAPNGTASQSTDLGSSYLAIKAIDGNYGNFSHTDDADSRPWWQVDLGEMKEINDVQIYNRNGYDNRLVGYGGFRVEVLEDDGTTVAWTNNYVGATYSKPFSIDLSGLGIEGQIVKLTKLDPLGSGHDAKTWNLAEVEVNANVPGDFTMITGGTLEIELAADVPNADKLDLGGELTIQPGATLDVLLLTGSLSPSQTFDILDFGTVVGTFDTVNLPGGPARWDTSNLYTTGQISVQGTVIPEPLTMLAVAMSVAGLGGYVRKRRRA